MTLDEVRPTRGKATIIRVDGTVEADACPASNSHIRRSLGVNMMDTVILSKHRGEPDLVMIVDDVGMCAGSPVNPKATELYHRDRITPYAIHGHVAIAHDRDFA